MATTDYQHIRTILPLIETRLVEQEVVPTANAIVWAFPGQDVPHFITPRYIVLRVGDERPREGDFFLGSGSTDRRVTRIVNIELRTRVLTDKANDKIEVLTDAAKGHLQFEELVFDALDDWHPTATSVGGGVYELSPDAPIEWLGTSAPATDPVSKDWVLSTITLRVPYTKNVTRNGSESPA